tara:strand:- start:21035 stop:21268 length:234 start_codon:yes stop_codon:yes gene_type:complete
MLKKLSFLFLFFIYSVQTFSQCAMCKSVVESNIEGGSSIGVGLNDGILFLMAMPYLALLIIAFAWIRYNKASKRVIS